MENQEETEPKKTRTPLRINLYEQSKQILVGWHSQLAGRFPGIKISDGDLVNWMLGSAPDELSKRQLEWMLVQAKKNKAGKIQMEVEQDGTT